MKAADIARGPVPDELAGGLETPVRQILDAAPAPIRVSGPDRSCIWANRPWLDCRGRALKQELGRGWTEGIHPEDADGVLATWAAQFDARQPFRMQYRLRRHDGQYRWTNEQSAPRHATDGSFLGCIHLCTDIDEIQTAHDWLGGTA